MSLPAARWAELIADHARSGLSTRQFAAEKGVHPRTLAWWRSQLRKRATPAFVEVRVPRRPASCVTLTLTHVAVQIEVEPDVDLSFLRQIVEALS